MARSARFQPWFFTGAKPHRCSKLPEFFGNDWAGVMVGTADGAVLAFHRQRTQPVFLRRASAFSLNLVRRVACASTRLLSQWRQPCKPDDASRRNLWHGQATASHCPRATKSELRQVSLLARHWPGCPQSVPKTRARRFLRCCSLSLFFPGRIVVRSYKSKDMVNCPTGQTKPRRAGDVNRECGAEIACRHWPRHETV